MFCETTESKILNAKPLFDFGGIFLEWSITPQNGIRLGDTPLSAALSSTQYRYLRGSEPRCAAGHLYIRR